MPPISIPIRIRPVPGDAVVKNPVSSRLLHPRLRRTLAHKSVPVKVAAPAGLSPRASDLSDVLARWCGLKQVRPGCGPSHGSGQWGEGLDGSFDDTSLNDLVVAGRHFEDLEIFVGQRSRLHPGPGWDIVLRMLRRDLEVVRGELRQRNLQCPGPA